MSSDIKNLIKRLDDYFNAGGTWNPELADHRAVSDLLFDCREVLINLTNVDLEYIAAAKISLEKDRKEI